MIEEDESAIHASNEQDMEIEAQEVRCRQPPPAAPLPPNMVTPERQRLERLLADAESLHLGEAAIAEIQQRIKKVTQGAAAQQELSTSSTLRQALKATRAQHMRETQAADKEEEAADQALVKAQERLDAARKRKSDLDAEFGAEEAKLLQALKKAEEGAPEAAAQRSEEPSASATRPVELTTAELLDRVTALANTEEGRAAMAQSGLAVARAHVAADEVSPTQDGEQDPSDREIERLVATMPAHLHARLALRLAQPGVQASQDPQHSAAALGRDAMATRNADTRREERGSSRSPRRDGDNNL